MDFILKYTSYSNLELLKIIDNPGDYQPVAVDAAKAIFKSRNLSETEIAIAKEALSALNQEKADKELRNKQLETKVKAFGASVLTTVNPIQTEVPGIEKTIKIISYFFAFVFLFLVYIEFAVIMDLIENIATEFDFSVLVYFFQILIIPTAAILFYKRKKIGWTLLAGYLLLAAFFSLVFFIIGINVEATSNILFENETSGSTPAAFLLTLVFFGGILWVICKEEMRKIYTVDKKYMFLTFGIVVLLSASAAFVFFT